MDQQLERSLEGRVAIVTGASRRIGIGAAVARALAERGAHIFVTYFQPYDAEMSWGSRPREVTELIEELRSFDVKTGHLELDLASPAAVPVLFDAVEAEMGPAQILVNNATVSLLGGIDELTAGMLDRHYAVNVRGMALLCAEFVRRFQGDHSGRIINMSSGQGVGPMPDELAYVATKGAVEAFTVSLSPAVMGRGITVNAIDPGATDTGWMTEEQQRTWSATAPAGRVGRPEDAARLVAFLASDDAAWITGQVIHSRGGT